jgi:hypothetical protein
MATSTVILEESTPYNGAQTAEWLPTYQRIDEGIRLFGLSDFFNDLETAQADSDDKTQPNLRRLLTTQVGKKREESFKAICVAHEVALEKHPWLVYGWISRLVPIEIQEAHYTDFLGSGGGLVLPVKYSPEPRDPFPGGEHKEEPRVDIIPLLTSDEKIQIFQQVVRDHPLIVKYTLSPSSTYSDHDIEEILGDSGTVEVHALYNKENASWSTFHEAKLKKLNSIQSVLEKYITRSILQKYYSDFKAKRFKTLLRQLNKHALLTGTMAIAHYDKEYLTLRFLPKEDLYTFMRRAQNIFRDNWLVKMAELLQDNFRMETLGKKTNCFA